jgi:hypothetical protein
MPYLSNEISRPVAFDETHIEWLVLHIHKWCSLYDVTAGVLAERLENVADSTSLSMKLTYFQTPTIDEIKSMVVAPFNSSQHNRLVLSGFPKRNGCC